MIKAETSLIEFHYGKKIQLLNLPYYLNSQIEKYKVNI